MRHGARATLTLALMGTLACGPGRIVRHGEVNGDALDDVRAELSRLRGLAFRAPVPARAIERATLHAMIEHDLDLTYTPSDLERLSRIYARLGLLPEGTVLRATFERLYEGQVAALYDPRTKTLSLVSDVEGGGLGMRLATALTGRDFVGELLVAHELTHALQDQHWTIPAEPQPLVGGHGDALLARRALLEGDATLAGFTYLARAPFDAETVATISTELHAMPAQLRTQYPDVPDALRATLAFQYDAGTTFASRALVAGGWAAVDRAESNPPASTEQVLHPERYFERREPPVAVTLGGTAPLEAEGWRITYEDTLGELQVRVLAGRGADEPTATRAAAGWGGDRIRALERDGDVVLVWMTVWDTPADAAEFAAIVLRTTPDGTVEQRGDRVLVLIPSPADPALAAGVWAATRIAAP